jgi:hypothetical protein
VTEYYIDEIYQGIIRLIERHPDGSFKERFLAEDELLRELPALRPEQLHEGLSFCIEPVGGFTFRGSELQVRIRTGERLARVLELQEELLDEPEVIDGS